MCLLDSFCCCFSLRTGMHLICLGYMGLFSYLVLHGRIDSAIDIIQYWVYGGLFASICGWIGLRWEKKFFVTILFVYDICVSVARSGLIYMYYYYPDNMNIIKTDYDAQTQLFFLIWQVYFLLVEFSYLQTDVAPDVLFHSVPQNVIITGVRTESVPAFSASRFPVEYQQQLAYAAVQHLPSMPVLPVNVNVSTAPTIPQHAGYPVSYPPSHPNIYPNTENGTMSGNMTSQPFPYDAPPPYSEIKQPPSAPTL